MSKRVLCAAGLAGALFLAAPTAAFAHEGWRHDGCGRHALFHRHWHRHGDNWNLGWNCGWNHANDGWGGWSGWNGWGGWSGWSGL
jgi:hypothetical protein